MQPAQALSLPPFRDSMKEQIGRCLGVVPYVAAGQMIVNSISMQEEQGGSDVMISITNRKELQLLSETLY